MSLAVDPLISNILFTLNLLPHFARLRPSGPPSLPQTGSTWPFVTIIVALYKERLEDIGITVCSLVDQTYPKNRHEVLFCLEPDDVDTTAALRPCLDRLLQAGVAASLLYTDGTRHTKPYALNTAMARARGDYCAFYDASDNIDPDQVERAVLLMEQGGYDVAQARVFRKGVSLLSRLLLLDTLVWYCKYLPLLLRFARGFPLSGEGLFIRSRTLQEVGNFPDVLTEDALLGMMLTERNQRFTLLDSTVFEKAPRNTRAHFKQKLRWLRGYITCLRALIHSRLGWQKRLAFFLVFSTPVASGVGFLGWVAIAVGLLASLLTDRLDLHLYLLQLPVYYRILHYWSIFLAVFCIPLCILSTLHVSWRMKMLGSGLVAFLLPIYWIFVGFCSVCSFFRGTRDWRKTDR